MRVLVFIDDIFPEETVKGLLVAAKRSNVFIDFIFVSSQPLEPELKYIKFNGELSFIRRSSPFAIIKKAIMSDLIIGMPISYALLRILSRIKVLKFVPLYLGPGKVTKSIGFYKHPERGGIPGLKTYVKSMLLNTHYLASDAIDGMYCSAAFGYPISQIVTAPLPKYFFINEQLCADRKKERPLGILVAPTHRWGDKIPPLTKMLENSNVQDRLRDLTVQIFHSKHPDTKEILLDNRVHDFLGDWGDVDILITDYSSIGIDFHNSGGGLVIYYIPDRDEFEMHQGCGLFMSDSFSSGKVCFNFDELCEVLRVYLKESHRSVPGEFSYPNYFTDMLKPPLKIDLGLR